MVRRSGLREPELKVHEAGQRDDDQRRQYAEPGVNVTHGIPQRLAGSKWRIAG